MLFITTCNFLYFYSTFLVFFAFHFTYIVCFYMLFYFARILFIPYKFDGLIMFLGDVKSSTSFSSVIIQKTYTWQHGKTRQNQP